MAEEQTSRIEAAERIEAGDLVTMFVRGGRVLARPIRPGDAALPKRPPPVQLHEY